MSILSVPLSLIKFEWNFNKSPLNQLIGRHDDGAGEEARPRGRERDGRVESGKLEFGRWSPGDMYRNFLADVSVRNNLFIC